MMSRKSIIFCAWRCFFSRASTGARIGGRYSAGASTSKPTFIEDVARGIL